MTQAAGSGRAPRSTVIYGQRNPAGIDVTVVTPTVGRLGLLESAMASVQAQVGLRVQHVVVSDNCPDLARPGVAQRLVKDFPRTMVIVRTGSAHAVSYRPARTANARNFGIAMASGTFIAHLDDDNEIEPEHLVALVDALRRPGGMRRLQLAPTGGCLG